MIPASEVDWLDAEVTADAALTLTVAHRRSRYPVANGSLDRLIGVVHIQDIIEAARTEPDAPLEELAQAPLIVPETNDLGALLRDDDLNETVGTRLPQAGARTLAGLVFSTLGRRPRTGDEVTVDGVRLSVEMIDGVRIEQLRVELPSSSTPG